MITYDLDKDSQFTNVELAYSIEYILTGKAIKLELFKEEHPTLFKLNALAGLLQYMSEINLIQFVIEILKKHGFCQTTEFKLNNLISTFTEVYSVKDLYRIRAIFYSCAYLHEHQSKIHNALVSEPFHLQKFQVKSRKIYVNLDDSFNTLNTAYRSFIRKRIKEIPTIEGQKIEYNKIINSMADSDFKWESKSWKKTIKKLKNLRDTTQISQSAKPPHPFTKVGVYECFKKYVDDHIKNRNKNLNTEFMFLYHELKERNLIENKIKKSTFKKALHKDIGVITKDQLDYLLQQSDESRINCQSQQRIDNFGLIFKEFIKT